jgi:hypothetical protein
LRTASAPGQSHFPHLAPCTAFVDARLAVHHRHLIDAARLVCSAFEEFSQPWYSAYANATGAELAVLADLPDAPKRLAQAERTCVENDWAAACVARARWRLTGDRDAMRGSIKTWERIGARFELEYTPPPTRRHLNEPDPPAVGVGTRLRAASCPTSLIALAARRRALVN